MSRGIRSLELISAVLGMCVGWLLVAMVVYGVGLARERIKPPVVAWSLIAGGTLPDSSVVIPGHVRPARILLTVLAALSVALTDVTIIDRPSPAA
jgi:hypothetical protein